MISIIGMTSMRAFSGFSAWYAHGLVLLLYLAGLKDEFQARGALLNEVGHGLGLDAEIVVRHERQDRWRARWRSR